LALRARHELAGLGDIELDSEGRMKCAGQRRDGDCKRSEGDR
jgi:hypothetical protein